MALMCMLHEGLVCVWSVLNMKKYQDRYGVSWGIEKEAWCGVSQGDL